jgi:protein DGCR14
MFAPDADVSPYASTSSDNNVPPDPKSIKHGNTRMPEQDELDEPPSPTRSRIDAAIAGTKCI